jgi:hypothetical protein
LLLYCKFCGTVKTSLWQLQFIHSQNIVRFIPTSMQRMWHR